MWIGLTLVHDVFLKTLSAYIANWWAEVASCPEMVFFPIELSEIAVIRFPHIICRDLLQGMNYVRNTVSRCCWNKKVHMVFIRFHVFYLSFALNVLCSPEWHEQVILYRRQDFPPVFGCEDQVVVQNEFLMIESQVFLHCFNEIAIVFCCWYYKVWTTDWIRMQE